MDGLVIERVVVVSCDVSLLLTVELTEVFSRGIGGDVRGGTPQRTWPFVVIASGSLGMYGLSKILRTHMFILEYMGEFMRQPVHVRASRRGFYLLVKVDGVEGGHTHTPAALESSPDSRDQ